MISDHEIIGTEFTFNTVPEEPETVHKRHLRDETISEIIVELTGANWNYTSTDVNVLYADFMNVIQTAIDKVAPKENHKHKQKKYPWITDSVLQAQRMRDKAYRKFCISTSEIDWEDYKRLRNKVVSIIRSEKTKYYDQNIDRCKGDSKNMWRTLKEMIGDKKQVTFTDINYGKYNGTAEENFNQFYSDSIQEISESIERRDWDFKMEGNKPDERSHLLRFENITLGQLKKIVYELKNKSTSDNSLNIKVVKDLFCVIGYALLYLINTSLATGKVPNELKTSVIVPIPKVTKPKIPAEFRPINLLPVVDKIIEIIICEQLRNYFEANQLLFAGQSGFRANHSCESALQYVCTTWRREMNEGKVVLSVFVDLQRAFETIDRDILIKKLQLYGINNSALDWIKDYLMNRYQMTRVGGNVSSRIEITWGVPQGSVLGPLLFIIYVNDIYRALKNSFVNLFADDTLICVAGKDFREIVDTLNDELRTLYDWLCQNKLKLNTSKTKCMVIGSKANCRKFVELDLGININGDVIDYVSEIKYLGVYLDPQLSFSSHIDYLCKKLGKKIGFFNRIASCLSQWSKMLIYNTIILPHFNYCSSLLISCTKNDIDRLQIQQNKAMRIILNCNKYTPIGDMLQTLGWLTIWESIKRANLILIYKIEHRQLPEYMNKFLVKRLNFHNYNIRSKQNYNTDTVKLTSLQKSLFFEGVRLFNALPEEIKVSPNLNVFKREVFSYLSNR